MAEKHKEPKAIIIVTEERIQEIVQEVVRAETSILLQYIYDQLHPPADKTDASQG